MTWAQRAASTVPPQITSSHLLPVYPLNAAIPSHRIRSMYRVTIIASSSAVRAAINGAALEPSERLKVISVAGSARRMTTATIRVESAERQEELYKTMKDGIRKAGALAVVTRSQPRPRGTIARMRPVMFRTEDGGWKCPALAGGAEAWPQRLHEMLSAKGWVDEAAVGLICVGATPWVEVVVREGRWMEVQSWASAHRVAFSADAAPAMWGILIPAMEQDPAREADRVDAAQEAIGLETGWGEPTRVEFEGQSYLKVQFEAPENWAPVHKGWKLLEDDGSEVIVRLIAQFGCPDYADAEMVAMQVSTPPPPRTRPPAPAPPPSSPPTTTTALASPTEKDASRTAREEGNTSRKRRREDRQPPPMRRESAMQVEGDAANPPPEVASAAAAAAGASLAVDGDPPLPPPPPPPFSAAKAHLLTRADPPGGNDTPATSNPPASPASTTSASPPAQEPQPGTSNSRASSTPLTFYAVHNGKFGSKIYRSWTAAQKATAGASQCVHKKFQTEATAREFLADRGVEGPVEIVHGQ